MGNRPPLGPIWRARLFAGGVAEFQAMAYEEALEALTKGAAAKSGLALDHPPALCAPGWLITSEAKRAVRYAGLRYLIGMFSILDLRTDRRLASVDQTRYPAEFWFSRKSLLERYGGHDDRTYTVRERRN